MSEDENICIPLAIEDFALRLAKVASIAGTGAYIKIDFGDGQERTLTTSNCSITNEGVIRLVQSEFESEDKS